MSRANRKLITVVAVLFAAAALVLVLSRRPVLFTFTDFGELSRPSVTVFNPLRNRAPEQIAEQMLKDLRRGDVAAAMARVQGRASADIVEKERRSRLRRWKLVDRTDHADRVTLYYRTNRGMSGNLDSEVVVFLRQHKRGWLIRDYLPMY